MNYKKILALIAISGCISTQAQQSPLFGFNPYILNVSNPSMTRSTSPLNVSLIGRKYWAGISGSPEAYLASFSLSPTQYKSAFGGFLWSEKSPLISKQVIATNYAYSLKNLDEENNLRFGVGLDFISMSSNTSSILTADYNDPFYTALFNNNKSSVDFRTGATWNNSQLEIGLALQQIIKSKNLLGESIDGELKFKNSTVTNGHIKYTIQPDEDFKITPTVFWQFQKAIPFRMDISILAEKTGKLWGGVWIRPKSGAGLMAGIWALPDVKIGYMYEKTFLRKVSKLGNSHELMICYTPSFKNKESIKKDDNESNVIIEPIEKPEPKIIRIKDTVVIVKETRIIETVEKSTPSYTPTPNKTVESKPYKSDETKISGNFHVVTGLFTLENNAKNYSQKLKGEGYNTSLVLNPVTKQYYVSVGAFNSLEKAHDFINSHPSSSYKFWVKEIKN